MRQLKFTVPPFFEKERGQSELWCCTHFVFDFIRVALFQLHFCTFMLQFARSFQVAFFSRCILFMLHLSVCSTILMLHFLYVALFSSFTFLCCRLFVLHFSVLHFFHFALSLSSTFSCCTHFALNFFCVALFFMSHLFSCCTVFMLYLLCTLFMLHFFFVVHFSCCTFSILHFFHVELFSCCTFFTLYRFHASPFCLLRSFHVPPFLVLPHVVLFKHSGQQPIKNGIHHRCLSVKFLQF